MRFEGKRKLKTMLKESIKLIDAKFLGNRLRKKYSIFKLTHGEQVYNAKSLFRRRYAKGRKIKVLKEYEISVSDLYLAQYHQGDYSKYKHLDAAVRMMAAEEYYGKNDFGFSLYRRMQAGSGFDWTERFQELISSYDNKGFLAGNSLELDAHLAIMDGSHRCTLAIYHGQEFIPIKILNGDRDRGFDGDWFWKQGFSADECTLIKNRAWQIFQKLNYDFVGVIWPSAMGFADELLDDLAQFEPESMEITGWQDLALDRGEFVHLFKGLYHTDILDTAGMETKIAQIEACMPTGNTEYPIRVFYLRFSNPQIGINPKNLMPQSQAVKRIKTVFRKRYETRIEKYQYDVIMHISDNYLQSKFCAALFELNLDISEYFRQVEKFDYAILRAKESRQNIKFPKHTFLSSDSDILCPNISELEEMADLAVLFSKKKFTHPWIWVEKKNVGDELKVIIWLRDFMLYQFEFMLKIYGFINEFADECLRHTLGDQYKYLPNEDEIMIRIMEYMRKPKKKWYIPFIRKNLSKLDTGRMWKYLDTKTISRKRFETFLQKLEIELPDKGIGSCLTKPF